MALYEARLFLQRIQDSWIYIMDIFFIVSVFDAWRQ